MTGWRLGWACGPARIITAMADIQSQQTSNPCSIAQAAAEAALLGDQGCVTEMVTAFKRRHDQLVADLNTIPGVKCLRSEEHTSELQSLMRISYAVFCLKKKKYNLSHATQH